MEVCSYLLQSIHSLHLTLWWVSCYLFQRKCSPCFYYKKCISLVYVKDSATSLSSLEHDEAGGCSQDLLI